jgi:hypothetical protein
VKELLYDKLGSVDFLKIREIEKPTPKKNELTVNLRVLRPSTNFYWSPIGRWFK